MDTKKGFLMLCLLFAGLLVSACASSAEASVPFVSTNKDVTLHFVYSGVPETWTADLPQVETRTLTSEESFRYTGAASWPIRLDSVDFHGVSLFKLELHLNAPASAGPDCIIYEGFAETEFDLSRWAEHDNDVNDHIILWSEYSIDCQNFGTPTTEFQVRVNPAYCGPAEGGISCKRDNLLVFVGNDYVTFSAREQFTPLQREWIQQVLDYLGGGMLPNILEPEVSYTIFINN